MIIPTILEKEKDEIIRKLKMMSENAGLIQVDVVEAGVFDGKTYMDMGFLEDLDLNCSIELDLMVKNPTSYVKKMSKIVKKACANILGDNLEEFFNIGMENGYITGLVFNTDTDFVQYPELVDMADYVEFITVEPGGQGRPFDENSLKNVQKFIELYPDVPLQVDGGVNKETMPKLFDAGVRNFVIGSAIFRSVDPVDEYESFKERLNKYERENN